MGEDQSPTKRRTTVAEAGEILGISAEAVRGRIRRGTLPVEREGRTVYVLLEGEPQDRTTADQSRTTADRPADRTDALIAELQDRVRSLEEANRENRRIIAALTSRIPAIEAPSEERESPETVETEVSRGDVATDREQAASVLSGDVRDVDEGVTTSVVTQYVLVGCGIAGSAILYVVGQTDLALLTIGAALLLLSISDFFYTRSLVRWSYATAALGIIAVLIFVAASLLRG